MASIDPYAPCPCGSGQKFKWCCQKVEPYAERAQKLLDNGQFDAALRAIDEGLRKVPDNPWLLTRKAIVQIRQGHTAQARPMLERIIAKQPSHVGAQALLVRVALETDGPRAGAAQLQQALTACPPEARGDLALSAQIVGMFLGELGHVPGALRHLELAEALVPGDDPVIESSLRSIERDPSYSPWLRNPYELVPPPEGLEPSLRSRFEQAIGWGEEGFWASAASAFETLSAEGIAEADRNLGLCRLWMADDAAAVAALRRYIGQVGATEDAIDLEALCQLVAPLGDDDQVEQVHLIWPLKDRDALLTTLRNSDRTAPEGRGPIDPDDPKSFEVDYFRLLDRPKPVGEPPRRSEDLPRIVARVLVGQETVLLEAFDDEKLDGLIHQFTELAGSAIPPAHPKTKGLGKVPKAALALQQELWLPPELDRDEVDRLLRQERARVVREVWPNTPMPYLGRRTPRQAAEAGNARIALRAALCLLEYTHGFVRDEIDFAALRASLGVEPEPEIDPETVDIGLLHLGRLHRVPAERLDDEKLIELWDRARLYVLPLAMENAARAIADRPALFDREDVDRVTVFSDLANLALSRRMRTEAFAWLERGRRDEPAAERAENAVRWDMVEVRLRSRSESPESWVPLLAGVLERYRDNRDAGPVILTNLVDMGLIQMAPHPDDPDQMLLDSRPLQTLLMQYGPRVTTAAGTLGISATQGLWTPEAAAGGGGKIWTPGSEAGAAGEKPRLIIPGR
ncbi:MAG: tetratricopeptide repeat protein [Isosphaeraceae bacterium]|nr:tetratricopeptide repeat protein [Isosphaeraceae bacterium]